MLMDIAFGFFRCNNDSNWMEIREDEKVTSSPFPSVSTCVETQFLLESMNFKLSIPLHPV